MQELDLNKICYCRINNIKVGNNELEKGQYTDNI